MEIFYKEIIFYLFLNYKYYVLTVKCKLLNMSKLIFHVIKTPLKIVEAFQESYHSQNAAFISIMYAKPDPSDSEDSVTSSFLNYRSCMFCSTPDAYIQ